MNPWAQAERDFWFCITVIGLGALVGVIFQIVSIFREERRIARILNRK